MIKYNKIDIRKYPFSMPEEPFLHLINDKFEFVEEKLTLKKTTLTKIPIWFFWGQGIENAPEIVKICLSSLKANAPDNAEIIILSSENISEYVDLPNFIYSKVIDKLKNYTHFSDILRVALLYLYGGFWIDATYLVLNKLTNEFLEQDFWTMADDPNLYSEWGVNFGKYYINYIISKPKQKFFYDIYNLLCHYWRYNYYLENYYLVDGAVCYLYRKNQYCRDLLDNIPISNPNKMFLVQNRINQKYDEKVLEEIKQNTTFFKTTYKFPKYIEKRIIKPTYYGYLKRKYLQGENI